MLPRKKALSNLDIHRIAIKHKIPYWRGVYMRNELPSVPWANESTIINLGSSQTEGSHWCGLKIRTKNKQKIVYYYDSYGDLPPVKEIVDYVSPYPILYNFCREQVLSFECGHLCIEFLLNRNPERSYYFKIYKAKT